MRYSLISWKNANSIREIKGYSHFMDDSYNENNLTDIDHFCMQFAKEEDLKNFLLAKGLISEREWHYRLAIGLYNKNALRPQKILYYLTFQKDEPLFGADTLINYYLDHLEDISFMQEFIRMFESGHNPNFNILKYYYELKENGFLSPYSKERLTLEIKAYLKKFMTCSSNDTFYRHLRILVKLVSHHASLNDNELNISDEIVRTPINDEILKKELKDRYMQLEDNPTFEEKEAIEKRINEIENYFKTLELINRQTISRQRKIKKERTEYYD